MHAEVCPQIPEAPPWAAVTLWPIMFKQEDANAIFNVRELVAAVVFGALNAMERASI